MTQPILYAILSDIHANFAALQSVEKDARREARRVGAGEPRFVSLGDVVDYGPQPNECMQWMCENDAIFVRGNHDLDVAAPLRKPPQTIDPRFWPITLWTRQVLKREHKKIIRDWKPVHEGLDGLASFTLLHSMLTKLGDGYIDTEGEARENLQLLPEHTAYGIFGHTHYQGYFVEDLGGVQMHLSCPAGAVPKSANGWQPVPIVEQGSKWKVLPKKWNPTLFNPGSVGQPRRHAFLRAAGVGHDYRASYMLLKVNTSTEFQFRRVDYDVDETIRLLRERVCWEESVADGRYRDIFKSERDMDPQTKKLYEMVQNMDARLPELVEGTLIRLLR